MMAVIGKLWERSTTFLERWTLRALAVLGSMLVWCLLVAVAVLGYAALMEPIRERRVEAVWAETLGERGFVERFPVTDHNATALRVEELAREVGVRFHGDREAEQEDEDEAGGIGPVLGEYSRELVRSGNSALLVPPESARSWLTASREPLEAVAELLLASEPPVYPSDVAQGFAAPLPEVLPLIELSRRLLLLAVDASLGGDDEAAARHLEASWRLSASLWERPDLLSHLGAHAIARNQLALLRRRPWLAEAWTERLAALDPRAGMLTALRNEAWMATRLEQVEGLDEFPSWLWRWLVHEYALDVHGAVERLQGRDILEFQPDEFFAAEFSRLPRWNLISLILFPNLWDAWPQAHRLAVDVELTRRMMELCADPDYAPTLDGAAVPSVVEGLSWLYRSDGSAATIELDGTLAAHWVEKRAELPSVGEVDLEECRRRR